MKRLNMTLLILTSLLTGMAVAQSDSLADAARKHRQQQAGKTPAAKIYTNDNLPATETISTVGAPTSESAHPSDNGDATAADPNAATKDGAKADASKPDDDQQRQKTWEDWRDKIQKQKASVEQMEKDNAELERQFKLTTGNFYNSAQQRVYDGAAMAKEDAAYKEQMEQKKKALDDAKEKIDALQEDARRAGVPSGFRD